MREPCTRTIFRAPFCPPTRVRPRQTSTEASARPLREPNSSLAPKTAQKISPCLTLESCPTARSTTAPAPHHGRAPARPSASHHGFLRQLQAQAQSQHALRGDGSRAHGPGPPAGHGVHVVLGGGRSSGEESSHLGHAGQFYCDPPRCRRTEQQTTGQCGQFTNHLQALPLAHGHLHKVCFQDMNQINRDRLQKKNYAAPES